MTGTSGRDILHRAIPSVVAEEVRLVHNPGTEGIDYNEDRGGNPEEAAKVTQTYLFDNQPEDEKGLEGDHFRGQE